MSRRDISAHQDVGVVRRGEHLRISLGDTIDALLKGFDALAKQGVELPQELLDVIQHSKDVKTRHPKRNSG